MCVVEADERGSWIGRGVQCETPWEVVVFFRVVLVRRVEWIGRLSARVQIVQETEGVVPFQGHAFVREPQVRGGDVGVDEVGGEEGVESVGEQAEVGEAWELYLACMYQCRGRNSVLWCV
jgi:hypothetical protein